jgi:hypothetical protein
MPDLIILRLHPTKPMSGDEFRPLLNGLSITAYDLSFADSSTGVELGTAKGLAAKGDNNVDIGDKQIVQHYIDVPAPTPTDPLATAREVEAVATAVIVITPPGGAEYPTPNAYDLRLEIKRGALTIVGHRLDYNVSVVPVGSLSTSQQDYFAMSASSYLTLPPAGVGIDPSLAYVDVPPNGQPPAFGQLCVAIDNVLAKDPDAPPGDPPGDLLHRSPLTPAEARHVAAEIVWNRTAYPPPEPPATLGDDPFGAMYTSPPVDPAVTQDDADKGRGRFEAEQSGYYGTHEAEALRLAGFVFSASAAVAEELMSRDAERARLDFPVETGASTATTIPEASVALAQPGGLAPSFIVPAAYFYSLSATMPPQVGAAQRYEMARLELIPHLLSQFATALDAGAVGPPDLAETPFTSPATPFSAPGDPAVNAEQAARRLHALGSVLRGLTEVVPTPPIDTLVQDWLDHPGPTVSIDADFWTPEITNQSAAYLELLLTAVTDAYAPLIAAIKGPPHNVAGAAGLAAITDQQWRDFFLGPSPPPGAPPRVNLLPPFTQPGTPSERTEAFIRHLHKFFAVPIALITAAGPVVAAAPTFALSVADALAAFMAAYAAHAGAPLVFGTGLDDAAVEAAAADVFPRDTDAQAWLKEATKTIEAVSELTDTVGTPELRVSLMEALFARGFTGAGVVSALS